VWWLALPACPACPARRRRPGPFFVAVSLPAEGAPAEHPAAAIDVPTAAATSMARVWDGAPHPHAAGVRHPTRKAAGLLLL